MTLSLAFSTVCILLVLGGWALLRQRNHGGSGTTSARLDEPDSHHPPGHTRTDLQGEPSPDFHQGLKLYRLGRFAEAFPVLLHHAEQSHPVATTLVARMYYAGNGVGKDEERHRFWLRKAAALGDKSSRARAKRLEG